jgi:hypothetical protein
MFFVVDGSQHGGPPEGFRRHPVRLVKAQHIDEFLRRKRPASTALLAAG